VELSEIRGRKSLGKEERPGKCMIEGKYSDVFSNIEQFSKKGKGDNGGKLIERLPTYSIRRERLWYCTYHGAERVMRRKEGGN